MRARYMPRAAVLRDEYGDEYPVATEILLPEEAPQRTGLFDHLGRPLYRTVERDPFGFQGKRR